MVHRRVADAMRRVGGCGAWHDSRRHPQAERML